MAFARGYDITCTVNGKPWPNFQTVNIDWGKPTDLSAENLRAAIDRPYVQHPPAPPVQADMIWLRDGFEFWCSLRDADLVYRYPSGVIPRKERKTERTLRREWEQQAADMERALDEDEAEQAALDSAALDWAKANLFGGQEVEDMGGGLLKVTLSNT